MLVFHLLSVSNYWTLACYCPLLLQSPSLDTMYQRYVVLSNMILSSLLFSSSSSNWPFRRATEPQRGLPGEPGPASLPAHPPHPGLTDSAPRPVGTAWPLTSDPSVTRARFWNLGEVDSVYVLWANLWPLTPLCHSQDQAQPCVGSGWGLPVYQRVSGPDWEPAGGWSGLPGLEVDPASHWLWAQLTTNPAHHILQGLARKR